MSDSDGNTLVMIVDDEPENINILDIMLRQEKWDIRAFTSGEAALAAAAIQPPDLVLLDIRMPGMDGYEVCKRFKQDDFLCSIPVIFLSGATGTVDKVKGFTTGGADYITKPFAEEEVLARARTHLRLYRNQYCLEEQVRKRMKELAEAHDRLRIWDNAKADWLNMLSHELRTPLAGMLGVADILLADLPDSDENKLFRIAYEESRNRIIKLIDDAGLLMQMPMDCDSFHLRPVAFSNILKQTFDEFCESNSIMCGYLDVGFSGSLTVSADETLIRRAITDLMHTAFCCVGEDDDFQVAALYQNDHIVLKFIIDGATLSDSALVSFFDVGGQKIQMRGGGDFGLSAALSKKLFRLFRGNVTVRNQGKKGFMITAEIPVQFGERDEQ